MSFRITQKKILQLIFLSLIVFLIFFILSISTTFFPPLITSVQIIEKAEEQDRVLLKGRFPNQQDHSTKIIVNTKTINKSDIVSWSRRKIIYKDSPSDSDIHIIQIRSNEKSSNKKVFIRNKNLNNKYTLREGESQYTESHQTFQLVKNSTLLPFQPIVFQAIDNDQEQPMFHISTNQGDTYALPNYNINFDGNLLQVFLDEAVWYARNTSVEAYLSDPYEDHQYNIHIAQIFPEGAYNTAIYQLSLYYPKTNLNNLLYIPLSTTYQNNVILDEKLRKKHIEGSPFIHMYGNSKSFFVQSHVILGKDTITTATPTFYNNELPLSYLYQYTALQDIQALNKLFAGRNDTFDDITVVNMQLPNSFNLAAIKNYYSLVVSEKPNNNVDFNALSDFLQAYIITVSQLMQEQDISNVTNLTITNNLARNDSVDINTIDNIHHNIATALFLRSQGLIARTIVGFDVTSIPQDTKQFTNNYISWVEVLTKEYAWISINSKNLYERKSKEISLFVAEEFSHKISNNQNPYFPTIKAASILNN